MKSGRPDVYDHENNDITSDIYVDLFEHDYILRQVLDNNHIILKGRRGTGKSTIFVKAEKVIEQKEKESLPIYINLQTCYEEIKTSNIGDENNELTRIRTYKNFLNEILRNIQRKAALRLDKDDIKKFNELFEAIENGEFFDIDFQRNIEIAATIETENKKGLGAAFNINNFGLKGELGQNNKVNTSTTHYRNEIRIFSIHSILKRIKDILYKNKIKKVYLFIDDFSELSKQSQKVVVDSLISPIITSYNDTFKIKIAAYPGRIYLGNIDSTKIPTISLDFYDAFEQSTTNYSGVEKAAIDYIKRTLEKRLEVFTNNQIKLSEIFLISSKTSLDDYLKRLFECTAAIPRALGFILNYCYLGSINNGNPITMSNIDNAAIKYYEENIYADFINDARFKQSFYDDKSILDQIAQKNLMDEIIKYLYDVKRKVITRITKKVNLITNYLKKLLKNSKKAPIIGFLLHIFM